MFVPKNKHNQRIKKGEGVKQLCGPRCGVTSRIICTFAA